MKDLKHIRRFNESEENLNVSDVSDSDLEKELIKQIWILSGYDKAKGTEKKLPYKNEVPLLNRSKVEKLLKVLYKGTLPEWW